MDSEYRWKTYGNYRLILWVWMMGEVTVVFSPIEMSHNGFYFHGAIYILAAIFIGLPLVYSEICIAQYTNCDAISMWNLFPILRSVGVIVGVFYELRFYYNLNSTRNLFYPTSKWGPEDKVLLRSRKMFVPEIMTREFLYRQVRIHGYFKNKGTKRRTVTNDRDRTVSTERAEWSALTSN
ncbi:PREDICTED: uncharacterized protein LOC106124953 [Papilio xuthus]|uniref:Uncharacterized protein LOC106124953 n=1 Tax=Papilio xuthus TaxID=66420 RepID=A0AAJ6ZQQ4_PAPXU|nr:PREDICTED: uncharacterized protein LOC106124953 [Papilio xuthus]